MNNPLEIDEAKLTFHGSLNYVVQAWKNEDGSVTIDQYQPRKNRIWNGKIASVEAEKDIKETIERMKIAINQFQEFLEGKRDSVYYWELENEKH